MRVYGEHWLKVSVAEKLRAHALLSTFDGTMDTAGADYLEYCKAFHAPTGTVLIYTRDIGHHTSGWFKNPDYERCLHLSLSFREPFLPTKQADFDWKLAKEWADIFFGNHVRLAWVESPHSDVGRRLDVNHYRVFCDEHWSPIKPRGEVYTRDFTEKGWKSFSELHPEDPRQEPSHVHAG